MIRRPPRSTRTDTLFPYTTLFRSIVRVHGWNLRLIFAEPEDNPAKFLKRNRKLHLCRLAAAYQQPRIAQVALSTDRKKGSGGEFRQRHACIRQPGLVGTRLRYHQRPALDIVLHRIDALQVDHPAPPILTDREGKVLPPAPNDSSNQPKL